MTHSDTNPTIPMTSRNDSALNPLVFDVGRYSVAMLATVVAVWFRAWLQPWLNEECPFSLFYLSVLLTAWIAGTGPAVLAILLGTLAAAHFFIPPSRSLWIDNLAELVQLVIYVIVNVVAVTLFDRAARQRRLAENRAAENKRLGADLQEADRRKDEFLALLAHELRNPLAPIRGSMAILEKNEHEPATVRRVREIVDRQTQHLVRLTDDLLEVSRFCRGQIDLVNEPIDLGLTIRHAIEMVQGSIDAKSQKFFSLVPETPVVIEGDPVRLVQLMSNLLGNASKYTPASGRIRLVLEQNGDQATIAITDTGIGFSPEHGERIFEPFVQIDGSRTREYGGLGVGLTIAKRLVELHKGTLVAESRGPGLGSCFTITLPVPVREPNCELNREPNCEPVREPSRAQSSTDSQLSLSRPPLSASGSMSMKLDASNLAFNTEVPAPCKLLLVDDNEDAAMILGELFETSGYEVELAHDGMEAISKARDFIPSVIIMDIGLPGMDGYEVARQLRRSQTFATVKLIALTGWGSQEHRALATQAGFDLHLVKPIGFGPLLEKVRLMQSLPTTVMV